MHEDSQCRTSPLALPQDHVVRTIYLPTCCKPATALCCFLARVICISSCRATSAWSICPQLHGAAWYWHLKRWRTMLAAGRTARRETRGYRRRIADVHQFRLSLREKREDTLSNVNTEHWKQIRGVCPLPCTYMPSNGEISLISRSDASDYPSTTSRWFS